MLCSVAIVLFGAYSLPTASALCAGAGRNAGRFTSKHVKRELDASGAGFKLRDVEKTREAAPLVEASDVLTLRSTGRMAKGSKALHTAVRTATNTSASLIPTQEGAGYAISITFGADTYEVILDTGSSDLWLAAENVSCVDINKIPQPASECGFGPLAPTTLTGGLIPDENFNISYGDGEFLTGVMGYEEVGIGSITVPNQEVALVDYAYWEGDNSTSGLMGFAYPTLTSAFSGTDPSEDDSNSTEVEYQNWVFNAIGQGLMESMFSLALMRGDDGGSGQLALGGLPSGNYNQTFTSTPLKVMELTSHEAETKNFSYYTIVPDGFVLNPAAASSDSSASSTSSSCDSTATGSTASGNLKTSFPAIVDSGTTLMYLPVDLTEAINAAFDPPSQYIEEEGVYENYCDAVPPSLAVVINGTQFSIDGKDLLLTGELGEDPYTGGCIVGVQPMEGVYVLGDVFLKNVVAVFDIGASEMRFAAHEY